MKAACPNLCSNDLLCRAASDSGKPLNPGDILALGEGLLDDRGRVAQSGEAGRAMEGEIR